MPRPKPDASAIPLLIRFPPEALAEVDKARGEISRQNWIRTLVVAWAADRLPRMNTAEVGAVMRAMGGRGEPAATPAPKVRKAAAEPQEAPRERFTMDDVRPKFVSRLKPDKAKR